MTTRFTFHLVMAAAQASWIVWLIALSFLLLGNVHFRMHEIHKNPTGGRGRAEANLPSNRTRRIGHTVSDHEYS